MQSITIVVILVILLAIALAVFTIHTHRRLAKFFRGKDGQSLEGQLTSLNQEISQIRSENKQIKGELATINHKLATAIRGVAMTRFNPFPDAGSNQSFAIALTDEHGDGIVLSSLYARERMSVFAKPIVHGESTYELTDEESTVVTNAITNSKQ